MPAQLPPERWLNLPGLGAQKHPEYSTVLYEIRRILSIIKQKPEAALLEKAKENHGDVYEVAYAASGR